MGVPKEETKPSKEQIEKFLGEEKNPEFGYAEHCQQMAKKWWNLSIDENTDPESSKVVCDTVHNIEFDSKGVKRSRRDMRKMIKRFKL